MQEKQTDSAGGQSAAPFRPPHGGGKTFSPYPEHASTPPAVAEGGNGAEDAKGTHDRAWIHAASRRSGPTPSIVSMTVV